MRDLLITAVVLGFVPAIFLHPYLGILVWHWLSLMNPHRYAFGFANTFPFALIIAISTIVSWLLSREPKRIPRQATTAVLALLWIWTCLTTLLALAPALAYDKWEQSTKILLMALLTPVLVNKPYRLNALLWVAVGSFGFYGVKGGLFAIATGGQFRLYGPAGTFIEDNNAMALALVMVLPLMNYLRSAARNRWIRVGLLGAFILTSIAVLTTYSRGGLIGLTIVLLAVWLRGRHRLLIAAVTAAGLAISLPLLPNQWFERMDSIGEYQQDTSAQSRIEMWRMALAIAVDHPITGGGFHVFKEPSLYPRYNPNADHVRDVHSIYFEVIGEHGFIGLIIFISLGLASLLSGAWIRAKAKGDASLAWARDLAAMLQISIVGYAVSGAFLTLAFFDFYYLLIAIMIALRAMTAIALKDAVLTSRSPSTASASPSLSTSARFRREG